MRKIQTKFIFGAVIAVLIAVFAVFIYSNSTVEQNNPPSLESRTGFQGLTKTGVMGFAVWEQTDKDEYAKVKADAVSKNKTITSIVPGVNYLQVKTDMTMEQIFRHIDPKAEVGALAYYHPESKKFLIYPQTSYYDPSNTSEVDPKTTIVRAGYGFIFIAGKASEAYDVYDGKTAGLTSVNPCEKAERGWNLFSASSKTLKTVLKDCRDFVGEIYVQKDLKQFEKYYPKTGTKWENLANLLDYNLYWVYFSDNIDEETPTQIKDLNINLVTKNVAENDLQLHFKTKDNSDNAYKIYVKEDSSEYSQITTAKTKNDLWAKIIKNNNQIEVDIILHNFQIRDGVEEYTFKIEEYENKNLTANGAITIRANIIQDLRSDSSEDDDDNNEQDHGNDTLNINKYIKEISYINLEEGGLTGVILWETMNLPEKIYVKLVDSENNIIGTSWQEIPTNEQSINFKINHFQTPPEPNRTYVLYLSFNENFKLVKKLSIKLTEEIQLTLKKSNNNDPSLVYLTTKLNYDEIKVLYVKPEEKFFQEMKEGVQPGGDIPSYNLSNQHTLKVYNQSSIGKIIVLLMKQGVLIGKGTLEVN